MSESFGKEYKLCSKKLIKSIFDHKTSIRLYPYVIHYKFTEQLDANSSFQIVLSAPKRNFRKAHERNRIKRIMKEAIRKNKLTLDAHLKNKNIRLALFLIYTAQDEIPSEILQKKTKQLFNQLIHEINTQNNH